MIPKLVLFVLCLTPLWPAGVGAKYATRDPQECSSTTEPAKGVLSPALAVKYFACNSEHEAGGYLYLVENVKIDIGKGTPFLELDKGDRPSDADPKGLVHPIRGSLLKYQCGAISTYTRNEGKNCTVYEGPKATGICYRTSFGDWTCNMMDLRSKQVSNQPAPARK